jgi:putative transposase
MACFSTKERAPLIPVDRQGRLWAYRLGMARNLDVSSLAIGGITNHVHILLSLPPSRNLAKVVCDLKANSSRWLHETGVKFVWQEGYGAFSVNPSRVDAVQQYIRNQAEHHKQRDFQEEFVDLQKSGISCDEKYVFG